MTLAVAAAAALVCLSGRATMSAGQPPADDLARAVDTISEAALRELRLPSLSIAIARGSGVLLAKAYGLAEVEHDVRASERTVYRIGSITKQFTAAAILRLVEQRKLSLDDPISRYVPGLQTHGRPVSIRQLLNHTSGIRSFTAIPAFASKERLDLTDDELLGVFQNEPFDFEPGTNFLYNNSAYYLLAMVIERVSGRAYRDYMQDEVFVPLGLAGTRACDDNRVILHRARGYTVSAGALQNAPFISMAPPKGGGNLCSTALDLANWTHALADGRIVSRESHRSVEQLWERLFEHQGHGIFAAVENPQFRLVFTPVEPRSTRLSITLSGRAAGDAIRVDQLGQRNK